METNIITDPRGEICIFNAFPQAGAYKSCAQSLPQMQGRKR